MAKQLRIPISGPPLKEKLFGIYLAELPDYIRGRNGAIKVAFSPQGYLSSTHDTRQALDIPLREKGRDDCITDDASSIQSVEHTLNEWRCCDSIIFTDRVYMALKR